MDVRTINNTRFKIGQVITMMNNDDSIRYHGQIVDLINIDEINYYVAKINSIYDKNVWVGREGELRSVTDEIAMLWFLGHTFK